MKTKELRRLTLSYYDGEEIGRPTLPKEKYGGVPMCQWVCDHLKIPYQSVCITEWLDDKEDLMMILKNLQTN